MLSLRSMRANSVQRGMRYAPRFARGMASEAEELDLVVIGAGPGGYVAAIKAAQLGLKTACIDKRGPPGGTCLNVGCIPSKALLNNSHLYHEILTDTKKRGIDVDPSDVKLNWPQFQKSRQDAVDGLTSGVEMLFKKNKIEYFKGNGSFVDEHTVKVELNEGGSKDLKAKNIIIATGSEATPFPGVEIDEKKIVSSTGVLTLEEVPKRLSIIGGGIIGLEMGSVYSRLGSEVTVIEFQNAIGGAGMDAEVAKATQKFLKKQGINFKLQTKVLGAKLEGDVVHTEIENVKNNKTETIESDVLLVAIGRRPYTEGLNVEALGLDIDAKGRIVIDQEYRTKYPHIRTIGDVTFGAMLAHKAEDEGIAAAEYIKTGHGHVNYGVIPAVMYSHPEVAWVGQNEQDLKAAGIAYNVGRFPFAANSRAKTNLDTEGFVKILADKETDRVLGAHIVGPNAGEMIAEAALAIEYGASSEDIARTCHAHPTLSEAFKEAAMDAYDKPINF